MNKHLKTYSLLVLTLVIWVMVIFKIFDGLSPKQPVPHLTIKEKTVPTLQHSKKKDSFQFYPLQRDPFLGSIYGTSSHKKKQQTKKKFKHEVPIPDLSYMGSIQGTGSSQTLFILRIDGESYFFTKGQTINAITLVHGTSKTVRIRYEKKTFDVKRSL